MKRAALALLVLTACRGEPEAPPPPPAAPLAFAQKTEAAEVSMTLPSAITVYPALHLQLYTDGKRELSAFAAHAAQNKTRTDAAEFRAPYHRKTTWTVAADTARLISLTQAWDDYTGGVHPNQGTTVLLWDKVRESPIRQSDLFRGDADQAALDALLCAAARDAKAKRLGAQVAVADTFTCPTWRSAEAGLAPSTVPDKAGGLIFYFDPHVLGAAAEGDYHVIIPQDRFAAALSATYGPQFAGTPCLSDCRTAR